MIFNLLIFAINGKLILKAEFDPKESGGKGGTKLFWDDGIDNKNKMFMIYCKSNNSFTKDWYTISTFNQKDPIKVLNVYPYNNRGAKKCGCYTNYISSAYYVNKVEFTFSNGTRVILPKSASLKVWMEGGKIKENGKVSTFEPAGYDEKTKTQLIKVTLMSVCEFEKDPANILKDYDCFFYGTWDASADQSVSNKATDEISKYIDSGLGVIIGHDVIINTFGENGFSKRSFREKLGITQRGLDRDGSIQGVQPTSKIVIRKRGIITNYPHNIGDVEKVLTVPATHTNCQRVVKGDVWMQLRNDGQGFIPPKDSSYLSTYNNTAFIQTGHSNCQTNVEERNLIANLIYYLSQKTYYTSTIDHSSQDLEKPVVSINCNSKPMTIEWSGTDKGSKYSFKVVEYISKFSNEIKEESNIVEINAITGIKEYLYKINSIKDYKIGINDKGVIHTNDTSLVFKAFQSHNYIHLSAIDYAGNLADTKTCQIPPLPTQTPLPPQDLNNLSNIKTEQKIPKKLQNLIIILAAATFVLVTVISIVLYKKFSKIEDEFILQCKNGLDTQNSAVVFENPLYDKNGIDDPFKDDF